MLPATIQDRFIQIIVDFSGQIIEIEAGFFALSEFIEGTSIYATCPFLESTLDSLPSQESFSMDGMLINSGNEEYNVDVELLKTADSIAVLIINRTNVYKYVRELNQNRNEISIVKHQIDRQNKELAELRKVAEKATEEKSRFLAMMSHEVRNPLNAILGYANMIATESNCPSALGYVKSLLMAGNNLKVIVNDILDISRIEAGKLELVIEPISIKETVQMCVQDFELQHKGSGVPLECTISEKIPSEVLADAVRLTQILSNLISNAYKFTKKGSIKLTVSPTSETDESVTIALNLKDTGRGMTTEQVNRMFNEYEQVELNDNRVYGGAGLGLSIVKRLVEAMNGNITVESEVNIGTSFNIEIPFRKVSSSDLAPNNFLKSRLFKHDLKGAEILYADDDELNHVIVAHLLSKEGASTTLVNDGMEALSALQDKTFDLILLDINMPNKSGSDLIQEKQLFAEFNGSTPIIALTANSNKEDIENYKNLGFLEVISKPYTPDQLISVVSTYYEK